MMLDSRSMVDPAVREALEKGYLTEENLDKAVYSTLLMRFKLGDFDEDHPYAHIDPAKLASPAHKALAVKAAKESVILLESRGMLPLKDDGKCTVAVVGPLANENYTCWYCGYAPNQTPVVKGFREKLGEDRVLFDEGFDRTPLCAAGDGRRQVPHRGQKFLRRDPAGQKRRHHRPRHELYGRRGIRLVRERTAVCQGRRRRFVPRYLAAPRCGRKRRK